MTTTGANSASGKLSPAVLTDFDDTAAVQNVAELLLNRFGDPTWTEVRQQFRNGEMDLKEYQEITFRNIRADRSAMQHFVRERATLRPFFGEVHDFCRRNEIPLAVVSQGWISTSRRCLKGTASGMFPYMPSIPASTKGASPTITTTFTLAGKARATPRPWLSSSTSGRGIT